MRDTWRRARFREVLTPAGEKVNVSDIDYVPYAGVRLNAGGVYAREVVPAKEVKARTLTRITKGHIVYNRMWATKGSFGVVDEEADGCLVTNDFPVFEADISHLLPGYCRLIFATPWFQFEAAARATGTTERRRLKEDAFLDIEVLLPSVEEQRRIVDLVASIDDAIAISAAWVEAVQVALNALLRESFEPWPESSLKLGDLVDMSSGPSWKASQEARSQVEGSIPVLKIGNTPPSGQIDLSDVTFVSGLPESTKTLRENDLILIRTNGNRERIGNVYRAIPEVVGFGYSAFQIALRPRSGVNSAYLYWALRAPWVQEAISDAASGTTGLGNIAIRWLRELPIWMPDSKEAERLVAVFESIESAASKAQRRLTFLRVLRGKVLQELLSGKHEIPESYDHLLEDAS